MFKIKVRYAEIKRWMIKIILQTTIKVVIFVIDFKDEWQNNKLAKKILNWISKGENTGLDIKRKKLTQTSEMRVCEVTQQYR